MKFYSVLLLSYGLSACVANRVTHDVIFFDNAAKNAFEIKTMTLKQERSSIAFENGETADNCETYYQLQKESHLEETVNNMSKASEYNICEVLKLIEASKGTFRELPDKGSLGHYIAHNLDLREMRSSLYQRTTDEAFTLATMIPTSKLQIGDTVAQFVENNHAFSIEALAAVQLNNNDKPDLIVRVVDEYLDTNYRSYSVEVLYDVSFDN